MFFDERIHCQKIAQKIENWSLKKVVKTALKSIIFIEILVNEFFVVDVRSKK